MARENNKGKEGIRTLIQIDASVYETCEEEEVAEISDIQNMNRIVVV